MSISPTFQTLCELRGIGADFLHPQYSDLSDPFTMHDMSAAVDLILHAIDQNMRIAIYADYDADGIPGAVVLSDFFTQIAYTNFTVYIPHRHNEGYGLHRDAIDTLHADGVELLITIDLGITAVDEIAYAIELGMHTIVTDHHEPDATLPDSLLVHPKLGDYTDRMLCGSAVVFQLVRALAARARAQDAAFVPNIPIGFEKWMLDMVGIATLSDMVPLQNENRILSYFGLKVLRKTRRPGLHALASLSRVSLPEIDETGIGFRIVPYINAASRMAHPELAFQLLSSNNHSESIRLAGILSVHNTARKSAVDKIMKTALQIATAQHSSPVLWVGDPDWSVGVLSIIAGRLSEQFNKPVLIWTHHESEFIKGSARCPVGYSIIELFQSAPSDLFLRSGGHEFAGGFTLHRSQVDNLHIYMQDFFTKQSSANESASAIEMVETQYDMLLSLQGCNELFVSELDLLRPYGAGNKPPVFKFLNVRPVERKLFGKTSSHEKIILTDDSGVMRTVLLFSGDRSKCEHWEIGKAYTIYASIEISGEGRWREIVLKLV